ncbi:unnamed protein product [Linum trigynum]|uniref:Uncharacterized protein n=1 Tax=Linum trigynum TaxID=586398 RepID=A0AAV2FC10_9ROSI
MNPCPAAPLITAFSKNSATPESGPLSSSQQLQRRRHPEFIAAQPGDNDDHRLSTTIIATVLSSLRQAKSKATRGSILFTSSQGRFFSNGFDLGCSRSELVSLPMLTVTVVQGHAVADRRGFCT